MKKRIVSLVMAAALLTASVTGCKEEPLNGNEVVAEYGDKQIPLSVAEFYARYEQAQYETYYMSYYGENMWELEVQDGKNYEESVKDSILSAIQLMYVLEDHMAEYQVEFTAEEEAAIEEAAKTFVESNDEEALATVFGTEDTVKEVFRLFTIQAKMHDAVIQDVDTVVSDEEAAQKTMEYVFFPYEVTDQEGKITQLTEEEKEALKETADKMHEDVKSGKKTFKEAAEEAEVEASTLSFDVESVVPNVELVKAADTLAEGGLTEVIVDEENGCYMAQVTSVFDRAATEQKKLSIVEERQSEYFNEICTKWLDETELTVHEDIWDRVDFEKKGVTIKTVEKETEENEK